MVVSEYRSGPDGFKRTRKPLTAATPVGVVTLEAYPETVWASAAETSRAVAYHRVFQLIFQNLILSMFCRLRSKMQGKIDVFEWFCARFYINGCALIKWLER
jgi:hypothetical protein